MGLNPIEVPKFFSGLFAIAELAITTAMIIPVFKLCIFCISHHLHVSFLLRVKVNSTNWPSPSVWVFIAQLVEHCSANSEAMGLNPVEVPKFFSGLFAIGLLHLEVMTNASFKQ